VVGGETEEDADVNPRQERGIARRRRSTDRKGSGAEEAFDRLEAAKKAAAEMAAQQEAEQAAGGEQVLTGVPVAPSSALADIPDAPDFTPAAEDAQPEDAFAHYDSTISRARAKVAKVLTKAERYWRLTAGPALKAIRDNPELYKSAGFSSFERYVSERWDMSRPRAYQLIDSVRAMQALEGVTDEVPNERQLRAILPVVDDHGKEAAERVWALAEERGRTSGAGLEQAARDLGFLPALEAPKQEAPKQEAVWPRYEPMFRALGDLRGLRRVATETPERARELAARLRQAAEELEADLPATDSE
jgi:hypothetical protein